MKNPQLWKRISDYDLDFEGGKFPFSRRLARDNGWSVAFAEQAIIEYKKFVYLCVVADCEMTPSDEVDQVWHLHLTYTRDYWGCFREVLGADLHHGPTKGGASERARYHSNYDATFHHYKKEFGYEAPVEQWPPATQRFGDAPNMRRVNMNNFKAKVSRKWKWFAGGIAGLMAVIAVVNAQAVNGLEVDEKGLESLWSVFALVLVGVFALLIRLSRNSTRNKNNDDRTGCGASGGGCSTGCGSGCGGGCGGCGG